MVTEFSQMGLGAMTVTLAKWSIDEYHRMVELGVLDDRRLELLNGELIEMPSEGPEHAYRCGNARQILGQELGDRAEIREGHPITLPEQSSEPEPDVAVVESLGRVYAERHPYPENIYLLIENSYTSLAKDQDLKRLIYAKAGIIEYWLVNLKDRAVIVHRDPVDGDYRSIQTLTGGGVTMLAFPDVAIDLSQLL
jgi:Uma2 family endonuclease